MPDAHSNDPLIVLRIATEAAGRRDLVLLIAS